MASINEEEFRKFLEERVNDFNAITLSKLKELDLLSLLLAKNPYFLRLMSFSSNKELITYFVRTRSYEGQETRLGTLLEEIVRYVIKATYGNVQKSLEGIDFEFTDGSMIHLLELKSSPKWSNKDSGKELCNKFMKARKRLKDQGISDENILIKNGCCYGKAGSLSKNENPKISGQILWKLISKDDDFYTKLMCELSAVCLSNNFQNENETLIKSTIERLTKQFLKEYCNSDGSINYESILKLNAGSKELQKKTEIDNLIQDIRSIFVDSKKTTLDIEYIMSEVCVKLNVAIDDCASTKKLVKKTINENSPNIFVLKKNQVSIQEVI